MSSLNKLHNSLANFKRMIRVWFFTTGCCYVIVSSGLVMFFSLFLDRIFRFDWSQRLICLLIGISYIGFNVYHYILSPLFDKISDEYLCLSIEKRRPELSQKITSGYQLGNLDQPEVYGYSSALVQSAINECVAAIDKLKVKELIDNKLQFKLILCGIFSLVLIFTFVFNFEKDFSIWFHRNIMLENIKWPRKTILTIEGLKSGNNIYVPEGDPYELKVHANSAGSIPDSIKIKISNGLKDSFVVTNLIGINEYLYRFEKVSSKLYVVVYGGDDESEIIHINTIQKPEIESIKFKYKPPAYTGLSEQDLVFNQSSWVILENSNLMVEGTTNKPIVKLNSFYNFNWQSQVTSKIIDKSFSIIYKGENLKSGSYELKAFDEKDITKEPGLIFSLTVIQDKLPEISLKLEYGSEIITPLAVVPCKWFAKDDYGNKNANLILNLMGKDEKSSEIKKINLFENNNKILKQFEDQVKLSLAEFQFKSGQQLLIYMEASDFCIRNPEVTTRSVVSRLTIVSVEEFEKFLFDKEQELRVEIERLKKEEESIQLSSATILENIKSNSNWGNAEIKEMMIIEKKQKLMDQRNLRVINKFDQLLSDIQVNKIDDANQSNKNRIDSKIKIPLQELNEKLIPLALQKSIDSRANDKISQKIVSINELIRIQSAIILQYAEILKSMRKWEGYYETVGLLKEIIKEQKILKEKTENKTKENIKGVFDE